MLRLILTLACVSVLGAAIGAFAGFWLGDLALDLRLIKPNADIDDDAMIINMGVAMAGAVIGLLAGMIAGWRIVRQQPERR